MKIAKFASTRAVLFAMAGALALGLAGCNRDEKPKPTTPGGMSQPGTPSSPGGSGAMSGPGGTPSPSTPAAPGSGSTDPVPTPIPPASTTPEQTPAK